MLFQIAKYSRMRMDANKNTKMGHNFLIMGRFTRIQAASNAIYRIEMAFNKAKLARSNATMFISRPKRLNIFSIQNFKYIFKMVFCVSNLSFLNARILFLFHLWLSLVLPQIYPNENILVLLPSALTVLLELGT